MKLDTELRRRILAAYDVLAQYGPAFSTRFNSTYITLVEGPCLSYWPSIPTWAQDIPAEDPTLDYEYYTISTPEKNPSRKTVWSGIFQYPVTRHWMVTVTTPLDREGRHVASIAHDVLLDELMAAPSRTT
ncbi:PDC sensor domain-containing protein [Archangium violaceum]|uniref:PDC sensor domain-containing protein n=1 Tax=Archangium violaceum TaxID=83451 RepID=UPI0031B8298E